MNIHPALIALLFAAASLDANADCGTSPATMEYRSMPPLLAHEADSALVVKIHESGCVAARFPSQDIRHGTWVLQLAESDYLRMIAQIEAVGLRVLDPSSLQRDVSEQKQARASSSNTFYRVMDENIIEFDLAASTTRAATRLRFASLRNDLLNLPHHSALIGIASVQQLFEALANTAHEEGIQR